MEITTRFQPGEYAWIMYENKIKSVLIHEVNIRVKHGEKMLPGYTIPFQLYDCPRINISYIVVLSSQIEKRDAPNDIDCDVEENTKGIELQEKQIFKTAEDLANWLLENAKPPKITI